MDERLARVADFRRLVACAEAAQLRELAAWAQVRAAEWLDERAGDDGWSGVVLPGQERLVALGGRGTPVVPEFCPAMVAAELGLTQPVATDLVADALALVHRLPLLLGVLEVGDVEVWRVRLVASETRDMSGESIPRLDAWLAARATTGARPRIARMSARKLREAIIAHVVVDLEDQATDAGLDDGLDADRVAHDRALADRYVAFQHALDGTSDMFARLSTADAARLETALSTAADQMTRIEADSRPIDVRRSVALGRLAVGDGLTHTVLNVHHDRVTGTWSLDGVGTVSTLVAEGLVDPDHAHVTINPVIDLGAETTTTGYRTTPALRQRLDLAQHTHCAFPYCTRRPMRGDADHSRPHAAGGKTSNTNLHLLCRYHHRVKTHTRWTATKTPTGATHWTSPAGDRWIVHAGITTRLRT